MKLNGTILGIDTSNYTTSAALLKGGIVSNSKKLLPVAEGKLGLRQSDALFHHTKQLSEVLSPFLPNKFDAIAVSDKPRNILDSYMPCFLAGINAAEILAKSMNIPLYRFSHQEGHIAAALYSSDKLELLEDKFIAFHLSGGTSEGLLVTNGESSRQNIRIISKTLDLNAGQAIDRIGVMLGLPFPAGKYLDKLAGKEIQKINMRVSINKSDFSLSGIENRCAKMLNDGMDKETIASFCMSFIILTIDKVLETLILKYGNLPILFSGGVSSNSMMKSVLTAKYGAYFASPEFSADNASGVAILAAYDRGKK